jgi:Xaa-Pro aminopeptidase
VEIAVSVHAQRRDKLRRLFKKAEADALLVTSFTNVTYLTGFTGDDSYLLLTAKDSLLISDPRYTTQLEEECPDVEHIIRTHGEPMAQSLQRVVGKLKLGNMGIEAGSMTVGLREQLAEKLPSVKLAPLSGLVEELRVIKDKAEVDEIREAARYAERAFDVLRATLRPDLSEKFVADQIEGNIRAFGGKCTSFPPIVAVGPRAALPHARPTDRQIGESEFVLVDWGASGKLYKSDLTRVLVTGKIPPKLERVYRLVLKAQLAGIEAIAPGVPANQVDAAARKVISDGGFGPQFSHGLGHGLGLDIHEAPRLNSLNTEPLRPGMVVTVEPGIYIPGWGGVRIEDDILVTKTGHEVLTSVPKQWEDAQVRL